MSTLKRNVVANVAGSIWTALLTIAVLPIYLRLLGAELYGLAGFYATLQMLFLVLDLGLGTSVNRELARLTLDEEGSSTARRLVKTLELFYWAGAGLIFLVLLLSASPIAVHWLRPVHVSPAVITNALRVMGLILALQFPYGLYSGALLGLQRHVSLNVWLAASTTLRLLLPIGVLLRFGPDITLFFGTQALVMAIQTIGARLLVDRAIPRTREPVRVDVAELRRMRGYAAGVTAMTALAVVVLQLDKVLLSRFAPLQELGYYAVAAAAATGVGVISLPVYVAMFPRFSQLVAARQRDEIDRLYHRATQLVACLILPLAAIIAVFARELLLIWTRNITAADRGAVPLALLAIAVSASSLAYVPQALQLAEGLTRFAATINGAGVVFLLPAMSFAAMRYGGPGVAAVSALWSIIALGMTVTMTHRRFVAGTAIGWFRDDVSLPLAASIAVAFLGGHLVAGLHGFALLAGIAATAVVTLLVSVAVTPVTWSLLGRARSTAR